MIRFHTIYGRVRVLSLGGNFSIVELLTHPGLPGGVKVITVGNCALSEAPIRGNV